MDEERKLIEMFARHQGITLEAPKPEDSFKHSAVELDQGRQQAQELYDQNPDLGLTDPMKKDLGGARYPELAGVAGLFETGLRKNPGFLPAPLGNPDLWTRVSALDRSNGRMIWAGQVLQSGGETGELTAVGAEVGLCAATIQKAREIINDPATSAEIRTVVIGAFSELFRMEEEAAVREQENKKALEQNKQPIVAESAQVVERSAVSRAIEGFLKAVKKEAP